MGPEQASESCLKTDVSIKCLDFNQRTEFTSSLQEGVGIDLPGRGLPVVGNRLDQVTVGRSHANPEGSDAIGRAAAGNIGQDESGSRLADEGVVGDRAGAERRAHGRVGRGDGDCGQRRDDLVRRRHFERLKTD